MTREHRDDDALVERLRAAAASADPVPPEATLAARSALAYRRLDAELARLVDDDADELAGVRSASAPALLAFECDDCVIDVEAATVGDEVRLVGQVSAAPTSVTLERPGEPPLPTPVDRHGRFRLAAAPGPARLVLRWGDERQVRTPWVIL